MLSQRRVNGQAVIPRINYPYFPGRAGYDAGGKAEIILRGAQLAKYRQRSARGGENQHARAFRIGEIYPAGVVHRQKWFLIDRCAIPRIRRPAAEILPLGIKYSDTRVPGIGDKHLALLIDGNS